MSQDKTKQKDSLEVEIIKPKEITRQPQEMSVDSLLSQAVANNVSIETLERLVALKEKVDAQFAKKQFDKAMADFQGECPVIGKNKKVFEKDKITVRYQYAPIDDIVNQTKEIIAKFGLSYKTKITNDDKFITATCVITHIDGHSEESSFVVPIGSEQYMSDVQKFGARSTFAKRYAFLNAFGIMTGDEDNDAQPEPKNQAPVKTNYVDKLKIDLFKKGGKTKDEAIELFNKITGLNITELPTDNDRAQDLFNELQNSPTYENL